MMAATLAFGGRNPVIGKQAIIAVSPGNFGVAVVSPPLDDAGNSVRAQKAIRDISNALNGNPYAVRALRPVATTGVR